MEMKSSVKPVISTEAAVRDIRRDGTKIDHGADNQRATAQPELKPHRSRQLRLIQARIGCRLQKVEAT